MEDCWADTLGDCAGDISREHWFSRASFPEGAMVRMPRWSEARPLRPEAMVSRVLCQHHKAA